MDRLSLKTNSPATRVLLRKRSRSEIERSTIIKNKESTQYKIALINNRPSNIQVHIRIRPLISIELTKSKTKSIKQISNQKICVGNDREFNFDEIFSEDSTQENIFNVSVKPNLDKALTGFNCSLFAYGQTGSGKTYTIGTNFSKENSSQSNVGILPLTIIYLFKAFQNDNEFDYIVRVSFLEIYNDEIRDLLNIKTPSNAFTLREDKTGQVFISGMTETIVSESDDALNVLFMGSQSRKTSSTQSNESSSRSHAIFTLIIDKINKSSKIKLSFKVNFIDLAGSERITKSGVTGERFKESVSINSGLLALSKVIMALSDRKNNNHVPYRDSKLTRIIKDSLNGNSITAMIACVSPSEINIDETVNTLNYASFAKSIQMKPVKQTFDNFENVDYLKNEIESLKLEIEKYKQNFFYIENIKLKSIIRNLRSNMKGTSISTNEKTGHDYTNISLEKDNKVQEEAEDINNDLEQDNLESQYSKKLTECIELKNDNYVLKELVKALRERESNLMTRINTIESKRVEEESKMNTKLLNYKSEDQNLSKDLINIRLSKKILNENILIDMENISDDEDNLKENLDKKEDEIFNLNGNLREEKKPNKGKNKIETSMNSIENKIKKLKNLQFNLKQKLDENEYYKTKIIKLKNTEMNVIKKEAIDKSNEVRKLQQQNNKNKEALDNYLTTINYLKDEIRTRSVDLKNTSTIIKKDEEITYTNARTKSYHFDNEKYTLKLTNKLSTIDSDQEFLIQLKNLMSRLEQELHRKCKLEKRLSIITKEKDNFINLLKKYEERFKEKIHNSNKEIKRIETELTKVDSDISKEKVLYIQKLKTINLKVEKLTKRLDKLNNLRESTINEIISNETTLYKEINIKLDVINQIKVQIAGINDFKTNFDMPKYNCSFDEEIFENSTPNKKLSTKDVISISKPSSQAQFDSLPNKNIIISPGLLIVDSNNQNEKRKSLNSKTNLPVVNRNLNPNSLKKEKKNNTVKKDTLSSNKLNFDCPKSKK